MQRKLFRIAAFTFIVALCASGAFAQSFLGATTNYRVTITNLTPGQPITPPVVISHRDVMDLFEPGEPARESLAILAEDGDPSALMTELMASPNVHDMQLATDAPFGPGQSVSVEIEAPFNANTLTIVAMLATTNDSFLALDHYRLSPWRGTQVIMVPAYDAGSEYNSEDCDYIPGPPCGMAGIRDTDGAEGFVTISSGVHGFGDLDPTTHDWRNPVAKITIEPIWR